MRGTNDLLRHNQPLAIEIGAVCDSLIESGWYVLGPKVEAFERAFAAYCGAKFAIGVANGTDALEIALRAVGVGRGDHVILTANAGGYGTTALDVIGALPIYVDVARQTRTMDESRLHNALQQSTPSAIIVTHLYGQMAAISPISRLAEASDVPLIEDCAQSHGASCDGKRAGSWGDAATFSFYPTKNLGALGDGGAVLTSRRDVADLARSLRQYGWEEKYHSSRRFGRNSRLDEFQAAVLLVKLQYLDAWNYRRRRIAARFDELITHPLVSKPGHSGEDFVAHMYVITTSQRNSLADHLQARGIPHDVHYPLPDHRQPYLEDSAESVLLPETEQLAQEVLTLPCFPEMTDDEIMLVASAVNSWVP